MKNKNPKCDLCKSPPKKITEACVVILCDKHLKGAMTCKNKKFGHHFIASICTKCKILQSDLSNKFKPQKKIKQWNIPKENKHLHTDIHVTANDLYEYFEKKEKFGLFLGVVKRIGSPKAYEILSQLRQDNNKEIKKFLFKSKL